jgi:hypothetical protein
MNARCLNNSFSNAMASAESPEQVIQRFAAILEKVRIPYMLTGSFASGFHGAPRATQDIDLVIAPNLGSLRRLLDSLPGDRYYVSREAALDAYGRESLFNVVDKATGWKIDLICRKSREFSITEFGRRTREDFLGQPVYVASAEDTIIAKLEWAKLSESNRQLEDAAGIVRVQGDDLDVSYISAWIAKMGLSEQWEQAKTLAG